MSSTDTTGKKFDQGKPRYGLLLQGLPMALEEVVKTLTYGAAKYGDDNWRQVENAPARYLDASMRHEIDHSLGILLDEESLCYHLAHKICSDLFRLQLVMENNELFHGEECEF